MVVGDMVGNVEGAGVIVKVGIAVGALVTRLTPAAPEIAAFPLHVVVPEQPSRMMYVFVSESLGTVYCTCAHTFSPIMHCPGGRFPVPVSSYTTSTPNGS